MAAAEHPPRPGPGPRSPTPARSAAPGPARSRRPPHRIGGLYSRGAAQRGRAGAAYRCRRAPCSPWASGGGPAASSAAAAHPSAAHTLTHIHSAERARAGTGRGGAARTRPSGGGGRSGSSGRRVPAERPRASRGEGAQASERESSNPANFGGFHGPAGRVRGVEGGRAVGAGSGAVRMRGRPFGPGRTEGERPRSPSGGASRGVGQLKSTQPVRPSGK